MANKKSKKENGEPHITRKIKVYPQGTNEQQSHAWDVIRQATLDQNHALNLYMSTAFVEYMLDVTQEDRVEMHKLFSHMSDSKLGSAYTPDVKFPKSFKTPAIVSKKGKQAFSTALDKGVQYGNISLPSYRKDCPLVLDTALVCLKSSHRDHTGIYHNYSTNEEALEHLYDNSLEIFVELPEDILLKLELGRPKESNSIRAIIGKIFTGENKICTSSISIEKNKNKKSADYGKYEMFLYLVMTCPVKTDVVLYDEVTVGTNLGVWYPIACALNTSESIRLLENGDAMIAHRQKIQRQRSSLQSALAGTKGGHGYQKKMRAMERFEKYEANYNSNYNHNLAKKVVDFALEHHAKHINIEFLEGYAAKNDKTSKDEKEKDKKMRLFLKNWSYFKLQFYIKSKAERHGIIVHYVNPAYDSQTCSYCGHYEDGQRISRKEFCCKNPACKMFGVKIDADFNAARNVSMDTHYLTDKEMENLRKGREKGGKKSKKKTADVKTSETQKESA